MNKKRLINYLNTRLKDCQEQYKDEFEQDFKQYLKGEIDFINILLDKINASEFDI